MIALLLLQLATASPTLPRDTCTCAVAVESEDARVTRLRRELRDAELAVIAARVNASNERKRTKAR